VSQQTTNRSFDDLARALAEGSLSRRRALKLFAGTALAALIPSRALADDDCVRVCHVPFDRVTEECDFANAETRCVSRRERRRHLENHPCDCRGRCANCLTMCLPNGGTCSTSSDCCSGLVCKGPTGQGTCVESCIPPNAIPCDPFNPTAACGPGGPGGCSCGLEGPSRQNYCVLNTTVSQECTSSCDCPTGQLCNAGDGTFFCIPVCSPS
jgi:hypothetical protein